MDPQAGRPSPIKDRSRPQRSSGFAPRRVLWTAFGISAALHLIALVLYPGLTDGERGLVAPITRPDSSVVSLDGILIVELIEREDEEDEPEVDSPPAQPLEPTASPQGAPAGPRAAPSPQGPVAPAVPVGPSAAERLRVRLRDARLWAPIDPVHTRLSTEQRLELELAGRLEAWSDSVRVAEAARLAATDWTYTDEDGGRWGVSDGKIYLGDLVLPFPFAFGMNPQQLEEFREREWEWLEIQRGMATGEIRDGWKERAQAIRARRDQERARARPDTSGVRF